MNLKIVKVYHSNSKYGYTRYRLSDGSICLAHRYEMQLFLGRALTNKEHVHHLNEDKTDNRIENLQLLSNNEHTKLHHKEAETTELVCPCCNKKFERSNRYIRMKIKLGQVNYFCSRKCRLPKNIK